MTPTLSLPKTVVTTFLFLAAVSASARAQNPAVVPVPPAPAVLAATPAMPLADLGLQTPAPTSCNGANAVVLLDRIQAIVDEAMGENPKARVDRPLGTSGAFGTSGQVTIDRADLDEIGSEIQQLKIALQTYEPVQAAR